MFSNYQRKLNELIWMGIVTTFLTSIFSVILIGYVLKIYKKLSTKAK